MLSFIESLLAPESEQNLHPLTIEGSYEFYLEPTVKGNIPDHTTTIVLSCFSDSLKKKTIDFETSWYKVIGGETYQIVNYSECFYHLNSSDIDLKIKAVVRSKDKDFPGTAHVFIGPVVLDYVLKPELEGMLLNGMAFSRVNLLSYDEENIEPNLTTLRLQRPNLYIDFDRHLQKHSNLGEFFSKPFKANFESDELKISLDIKSITTVIVAFKEEDESKHKLKLIFESRMQRDIFYVFLKLSKLLKEKTIKKQVAQYDELFDYRWCFLNISKHDMPKEGNVEYENIFEFDLKRELMKTMVRLNKELNEENLALVDSLEILEKDLDSSAREFKSLLEDTKAKNPKNLRQYEKSSQSIMQETSVIIEGVKQRTKKKRRELESSMMETMRNTEDDLKSIKLSNEVVKREIEILKQTKDGQSQKKDGKEVNEPSVAPEVKTEEVGIV